MLENNPVLRERVLGVTAISAILIGGAVGFDTMLTSGWQIGAGGDAHAAYAAMTPQSYFDDVSRDWTSSPPQRVELARADVGAMNMTQPGANLDGATLGAIAPNSSATTATAPAPEAAPQAQVDSPMADSHLAHSPMADAAMASSSAAEQRFDAIEADIQQATSQLDQSQANKDSELSTASGHQD